MFKFIRQVRLAGVAVQIIGLLFQNVVLSLIGVAVFFVGIGLSIAKTEAVLEEKFSAPEED